MKTTFEKLRKVLNIILVAAAVYNFAFAIYRLFENRKQKRKTKQKDSAFELIEYSWLLQKGLISQEEFENAKKKLL
ncbi:MAG: SHOCT domain-containing protein [Oscillospiraceae bacterium]|jgi:uncharacterized membrane protein|nr:SHOCT domain-containing protein [Oscillospiraceae bacterium]